MLFRKTRLALIPCVLASLFAVVAPLAQAASSKDALIPVGELSAACKKAKAEFHPLVQADIQQAKKELIQALDTLDKRLSHDGNNGENWRKYLRWTELQTELQGDKPADKALLTGVYQRYAAAHDGLELVWFLDVQRALRTYVATVNAVGNPQVQTAFDEKLDKLAASLDSYAAKPTAEDALVIGESIRWLEDARQTPDLIRSIRQHYVHPNLFAVISSDIVGAGIAEPVDDVQSIEDCILGTAITGTAHTKGKTSVELAPDPRFGVLDTLFFGTTHSENVGYHGPVTIFSNSQTDLAARKRIWIDADGLSSHGAAANAETNVTICDIQSNKGRRIIEKMAWKRAYKQLPQAESIASRHAEERLSERMDKQAAEAIDKANDSYVEKFKKPFTERKLFPELLHFSTTDRILQVTSLQAGEGKLAAPGIPPPVAEGADMSVQIHESMINNLSLDALSGRTVHEEKLQKTVTDLLGHLPEKMKGDEDGKPWAISFARRQPIFVTFGDNGFKISIHGAKYYKGGEGHPAMNVTATYKIEKSPKGFKAVRQGDIEVFPPDFVPGAGKQIDARRQVIRKLLEKRFAKVFEQEMIGEGLELPGKWKAAGKMIPIQLDARDGWLVIAWKRAPAETKVAESK